MELEECQEFEKFAELFREKHERIVRDEIGYIYGKFERWGDEKNASFDEYDLRCIDHIIYFHEKLFTWICDELIEDQMRWYPLSKKNWILKNRTILRNESTKNVPDKRVNIIEAVFYTVKIEGDYIKIPSVRKFPLKLRWRHKGYNLEGVTASQVTISYDGKRFYAAFPIEGEKEIYKLSARKMRGL